MAKANDSSNKPNSLTAKDLINIGIFTALYFVLFFAVGMIGYIPVLLLAVPFLCPFVGGIVFMLFLTRVKKFGMVTIMGIIISILMMATGHQMPVVISGIVFSVLGDLVLLSGKYHSWNRSVLGYVIFSEWLLGILYPIFFMREQFFAITRDGYGDAYADALYAITPTWLFFVLVLVIAAGALSGAYLGRSLLKKHFQRAGIV